MGIDDQTRSISALNAIVAAAEKHECTAGTIGDESHDPAAIGTLPTAASNEDESVGGVIGASTRSTAPSAVELNSSSVDSCLPQVPPGHASNDPRAQNRGALGAPWTATPSR